MTSPEWGRTVNPSPTVHRPPPEKPSVRKLTSRQVGVVGGIIVDLVLAQVALAIGNVSILGTKPFAFLTEWAEDLQQRASDAYKNSFAVVDVVAGNPAGTTQTGTLNQIYSAASTVNNTANGASSTAGTALTNAGTANTNLQTTWNTIYTAAGGTAGGNQTVSAAGTQLGTVTTTAENANSTAGTALTNAGTANTNLQTTWNTIYTAAGGTAGGNQTVSAAGTQLGTVTSTASSAQVLARAIAQSGSNLVNDPEGEIAAFWSGQSAVTLQTSVKRTGTGSLQMTSSGATAKSFYFTNIDSGAVQLIQSRDGDVFYVECWVRGGASNGTGTVQLVAQVSDSLGVNATTVTSIGTVSITTVNRTTWQKVSASYTVPAGYDLFTAGIRLAANETTSGNLFYIDDMLVREQTAATAAQNGLTDTNKAIYNGYYGAGASGVVSEVQTTVQAIKTKLTSGYTLETLTESGTWTRPWTPGDVDEPREFWVLCFGSGSGGNAGQYATSGTPLGGAGGAGGSYAAVQINPADITATVSFTVATGGLGATTNNGTGGSGAQTSFGSYLTTLSGRAFVSSLFGYYSADDSAPGVGGTGGNVSQSLQPTAGGSTPLATAGAAGTNAFFSGGTNNAVAGGLGGTAAQDGVTRAGGGGGGGGGGGLTDSFTNTGTAAKGGNGGFPGGGGGGGGAMRNGGSKGAPYNVSGHGGNGGAGVIVLLWK